MRSALVIQFLGELDRIKKMSGSLNEQTIRPAFRSLLRSWANSEDLFLLEEYEFETRLKTKVYPDGTIVHDLRVPLGYWEAKDTKDDLDAEITDKIAKGYPTSNIIFENSELDELLAPERDAPATAVAALEIDLGFVEKFHDAAPIKIMRMGGYG